MTVDLTQRDSAAILTLNRPQALNALSFEIIRELGQLIDKVASMAVRVLIVTGAGDKAFCTGADIRELRGRDLISQKRGAELGQATFGKLGGLPFPSIAVIRGFAFGGGLELALACDFRLATADAKLGLPEVKLGLIPGYGGTQRLPRLVGEARALEMILTGRTVSADEAEQIGLVNRLVDGDPIEAGLAFARRFTGYSLPVLDFARRAVRRGLEVPLHEGLKIEADLSTLAYRSADAEEGMAAFEEKRKPVFVDG